MSVVTGDPAVHFDVHPVVMEEKENKNVDIYVVMDKSGSMISRRWVVIDAFNAFIRQQKEIRVSGQICRASLSFFNNTLNEVYSQIPLDDVPELTEEDYLPTNTTALRDAMGHTLVRIRTAAVVAEAAAKPVEPPPVVLLVVITDGEENSSVHFTSDEITGLINEFKASGGHISYLGSNQDAITNGMAMGIAPESSLNYDDSNFMEAIDSMGAAVGRMRSGATSTIQFTPYERNRSSGGVTINTNSSTLDDNDNNHDDNEDAETVITSFTTNGGTGPIGPPIFLPVNEEEEEERWTPWNSRTVVPPLGEEDQVSEADADADSSSSSTDDDMN